MKLLTPLVLVVALMPMNACSPNRAGAQDGSAASTVAPPAAAPAADAPAAAQSDGGWPKQYSANGYTIVVYQPQLDSWQDNQLQSRAAVAVTAPGTAQPTFGVIWISARTEVDKAAGLVSLNDVTITRANFPTLASANDTYLDLIRQSLPTAVNNIALQRLQANLAVNQAEKGQPGVQVQNEPPRIIATTTPAILVLVDGSPALRQTSASTILRVINTTALLLLDQSSATYYLYVQNGWLQASAVEGPWTPAANPPPALDQVKQAAGSQVDLFNQSGTPPSPSVYVSTAPAELIVIDGTAQFAPISGTTLLSITNTASDVFMDTSSNNYYVLLSGRWFSSSSLQGPWTYVSSDQLPADFANIPEDHPKGNALASVSGTPQAQEAAITNTLPQTATVNRNGPQLTVSYDGSPQFKPVSGTSLQYAANTATPVIQVDSGSYYAVQNGLWFVASSPTGPWAVATTVPGVIYTIPPNSPVYYVTYVRLYGYTPDVVYVGYTPGYESVYITPAGTVVYGTGYVYPAWVGTVWYGPPATYGFGAGFGWGMASGFALGFAAGAWCHPWWGPVGWGGGYYGAHYSYTNVTVNNYYNRWGNSATVAHSGNYYAGHVGNTTFAGNKNGDVYAGHDGNVYRNDNGQWQKYDQNNGWQNVNHDTAQTQRNDDVAQRADSGSANRDMIPSHNAAGSGYANRDMNGGGGWDRGDTFGGLDRDAGARNIGNSWAGGGHSFSGFRGGGGGFRR